MEQVEIESAKKEQIEVDIIKAAIGIAKEAEMRLIGHEFENKLQGKRNEVEMKHAETKQRLVESIQSAMQTTETPHFAVAAAVGIVKATLRTTEETELLSHRREVEEETKQRTNEVNLRYTENGRLAIEAVKAKILVSKGIQMQLSRDKFNNEMSRQFSNFEEGTRARSHS